MSFCHWTRWLGRCRWDSDMSKRGCGRRWTCQGSCLWLLSTFFINSSNGKKKVIKKHTGSASQPPVHHRCRPHRCCPRWFCCCCCCSRCRVMVVVVDVHWCCLMLTRAEDWFLLSSNLAYGKCFVISHKQITSLPPQTWTPPPPQHVDLSVL